MDLLNWASCRTDRKLGRRYFAIQGPIVHRDLQITSSQLCPSVHQATSNTSSPDLALSSFIEAKRPPHLASFSLSAKRCLGVISAPDSHEGKIQPSGRPFQTKHSAQKRLSRRRIHSTGCRRCLEEPSAPRRETRWLSSTSTHKRTVLFKDPGCHTRHHSRECARNSG